jgi:hypothetical protein
MNACKKLEVLQTHVHCTERPYHVLRPCGLRGCIHGIVALERVEVLIQVVQEVRARKCQHLNLANCTVLTIARQPHSQSHIAGMPVVHEHHILGLLYTHNGCAAPNLQAR